METHSDANETQPYPSSQKKRGLGPTYLFGVFGAFLEKQITVSSEKFGRFGGGIGGSRDRIHVDEFTASLIQTGDEP